MPPPPLGNAALCLSTPKHNGNSGTDHAPYTPKTFWKKSRHIVVATKDYICRPPYPALHTLLGVVKVVAPAGQLPAPLISI